MKNNWQFGLVFSIIFNLQIRFTDLYQHLQWRTTKASVEAPSRPSKGVMVGLRTGPDDLKMATYPLPVLRFLSINQSILELIAGVP